MVKRFGIIWKQINKKHESTKIAVSNEAKVLIFVVFF